MANPQKENGYTSIANEILEILARSKFNGTQFCIIQTVIRYTYGFNRKSHELSATFISKVTGIGKRQVERELSCLINMNVITIYVPGNFTVANRIGLNKDYETWNDVEIRDISSPKSKRGDEYVTTDKLDGSDIKDGTTTDKLDVTGSDELGGTTTDKFVGQERNTKDIYKENIKSKKIIKKPYQSIFDLYNKQNVITHKTLTEKMKKAIDNALTKYSEDDIVKAIERYGQMYNDKINEYASNYCKYKWTLAELLSREKGISEFLDEGGKWIRYQESIYKKNINNQGSGSFDFSGL